MLLTCHQTSVETDICIPRYVLAAEVLPILTRSCQLHPVEVPGRHAGTQATVTHMQQHPMAGRDRLGLDTVLRGARQADPDATPWEARRGIRTIRRPVPMALLLHTLAADICLWSGRMSAGVLRPMLPPVSVERFFVHWNIFAQRICTSDDQLVLPDASIKLETKSTISLLDSGKLDTELWAEPMSTHDEMHMPPR